MPRNSRPLTVGVVGLGRAARDLHLPALASLGDDWRVIAGCDTDADARRTLDAPTFDTLDRLLAAVPPDVIVIATPPPGAASCSR